MKTNLGSGHPPHGVRVSRFGAAVLLYDGLASDCQGGFLARWMQGRPGKGHPGTDQDGAAMKNFWPFLFY